MPQQINRINLIHAGQLRYLTTHAALLDSRVCDGRYIEGHGDLRPEHIYLLPRPVVIDCIEFSSDLRRLDILDELSFLSMECEYAGHPEIGDRIVELYARPRAISRRRRCWHFTSRIGRASGRRCVPYAVPRSGGPDRAAELTHAADYLAVAEQYQQQLGRSLLIVVSGLMGSGKSTLAAALADSWARVCCKRIN